jgi:NADPH-dependent 2,4-dienoyl-CoA reductase/sulfur reductase-like enzyme
MSDPAAPSGEIAIDPWDVHNRTLVANVHPEDWTNPEPAGRYNLVVIGAGTAGLVTAAGAAGLGARVGRRMKEVLAEASDRFGPDGEIAF